MPYHAAPIIMLGAHVLSVGNGIFGVKLTHRDLKCNSAFVRLHTNRIFFNVHLKRQIFWYTGMACDWCTNINSMYSNKLYLCVGKKIERALKSSTELSPE
ncbi:hypothetical protein FKM82_023556 [Ascaphus truei]